MSDLSDADLATLRLAHDVCVRVTGMKNATLRSVRAILDGKLSDRAERYRLLRRCQTLVAQLRDVLAITPVSETESFDE